MTCVREDKAAIACDARPVKDTPSCWGRVKGNEPPDARPNVQTVFVIVRGPLVAGEFGTELLECVVAASRALPKRAVFGERAQIILSGDRIRSFLGVGGLTLPLGPTA
jgi:hypothetical protein